MASALPVTGMCNMALVHGLLLTFLSQVLHAAEVVIEGVGVEVCKSLLGVCSNEHRNFKYGVWLHKTLCVWAVRQLQVHCCRWNHTSGLAM